MSAHVSQLNAVALTKNVLRALEASSAEIPPLEAFPKSHAVAFKYYRGVIAFLDEHYTEVGLQCLKIDESLHCMVAC